MSELLDMELAAGAFRIGPVQRALQAALLARLTPANCALALARMPAPADNGPGDGGEGGGEGGDGGGGEGVWCACVAAARRDWDDFASSKAFLDVPEAALEAVLAGNDLRASCEEAVFLAVVRWITRGGGGGGGGALRGEGLLTHVRFPLMSAGTLAAAAAELPCGAGLAGLVAEAEALLRLSPEARLRSAQAAKRMLRPSCIVPRMVGLPPTFTLMPNPSIQNNSKPS